MFSWRAASCPGPACNLLDLPRLQQLVLGLVREAMRKTPPGCFKPPVCALQRTGHLTGASGEGGYQQSLQSLCSQRKRGLPFIPGSQGLRLPPTANAHTARLWMSSVGLPSGHFYTGLTGLRGLNSGFLL